MCGCDVWKRLMQAAHEHMNKSAAPMTTQALINQVLSSNKQQSKYPFFKNVTKHGL